MQRCFVAGARAVGAIAFVLTLSSARANAIPVFANGQGVSCETCHTTFPGMTRYGMMVMMSNFQILNRHLQDNALPISVRLYITALFANKDRPGSVTVDDLSLLSGGFLERNVTWYAEQHTIDSGVIGQTEQLWLSWNGLLHGTNSLQLGKIHTPFPFMPAHAWTIGDYLLATQTTGQNHFNPNDSRWGAAFNGMSNEFMYNLSWLTGSGPLQDALDYNRSRNPHVLDLNVSYGGMSIPWSVGAVAMRGYAPLVTAADRFASTEAFTREGLYFGYQTNAWHYQTMYYHGFDEHPAIDERNVRLNGFFFEVERDLGWRNHVALRYDVASSDTLSRHYILDYSHQMQPNLALIGELTASPGVRAGVAFRIAYAGPYQYGERYLSNLHVVPAQGEASAVTAASAPTPPANAGSTPAPAGDVNAGARLVQSSGCEGCHGAGLKGGGIGPALYGVEHRLTNAQIEDAIRHPRAPMPNFGFSDTQIADIEAYLTNLDGGAMRANPVVTIDPSVPTDHATVTARFPGNPPQRVTVTPIMVMGGTTMPARTVTMQQSAGDPHIFTGVVVFSMGGPWTIRINYDGKAMDVPLTVGS